MLLILFLLIVNYVQAWLKCASIYGLETENRNFVCQNVNYHTYYLDHLKSLGFNTVRLPFSYQWVTEGDFSKMDDMIGSCYVRNISVILDFHRVWSSHQGPSPEEGISMDDYVNSWITMLDRYTYYPNVIGHNAFNEYQGSDIDYLKHFSSKLFTTVEERYPNRFLYFATGYNWAGNLRNFSLEDLPFHDRIVYSIHKYAFSGTADREDWDYTFPVEQFPANKVGVGEFGFLKQDEGWAIRFIDYLRERGIQSACFWTVAHSHDTDGLWRDDCVTFDWGKFNIANRLWTPLGDT